MALFASVMAFVRACSIIEIINIDIDIDIDNVYIKCVSCCIYHQSNILEIYVISPVHGIPIELLEHSRILNTHN